jgi:O-acetylhomoserine/O-acetylserine sulfhydrylase-like pyridoxal-dependent enzyme
LSNGSVFAEDVVHFLGCDSVRKVFDVENAVYLRRQTHLHNENKLKSAAKKLGAIFCFDCHGADIYKNRIVQTSYFEQMKKRD